MRQVYSFLHDHTIANQLFFSIKCVDSITGQPKTMKYQLVPRVIHESKYNKLQTSLPNQYEWSFANTAKDFKWDKFILTEKQSLCSLLADHYGAAFDEDLVPADNGWVPWMFGDYGMAL